MANGLYPELGSGWVRSETQLLGNVYDKRNESYVPFFSPLGVVFTNGASSSFLGLATFAFTSPTAAVVAFAALLAANLASLAKRLASFFARDMPHLLRSWCVHVTDPYTDLHFWSLGLGRQWGVLQERLAQIALPSLSVLRMGRFYNYRDERESARDIDGIFASTAQILSEGAP